MPYRNQTVKNHPALSLWLAGVWTLLLGLALCAYAPRAHATMTCTFSSTPTISFGAVDVLSGIYPKTTASMNVTCKKRVADIGTRGYLCLYTGDGSASDPVRGSRSTTYQPRFLSSGTNYAGYQIYTDPGYSTFWGTYAPNGNPNQIFFDFSASRTVTQTVTFYAQMAAISPALNGTTTLQTIIPGSYTSNFTGGHTLWSSTLLTNQTVDVDCNPQLYNSSGQFPFYVNATVNPNCVVQTASNISFGTQVATATNLQASAPMSIACTNTTPYYIGLKPGNNSTTGAGTMHTVATPSNTDLVPYQLRQTTGLGGTIWGNTATSSSAGNGVAGTGTGAGQSYTIYATVPSTAFTPDNYIDTVTITVNY